MAADAFALTLCESKSMTLIKIRTTGFVVKGICDVQTPSCIASESPRPITVVFQEPSGIQCNLCKSCMEDKMLSGGWYVQGTKTLSDQKENLPEVLLYEPPSLRSLAEEFIADDIGARSLAEPVSTHDNTRLPCTQETVEAALDAFASWCEEWRILSFPNIAVIRPGLVIDYADKDELSITLHTQFLAVRQFDSDRWDWAKPETRELPQAILRATQRLSSYEIYEMEEKRCLITNRSLDEILLSRLAHRFRTSTAQQCRDFLESTLVLFAKQMEELCSFQRFRDDSLLDVRTTGAVLVNRLLVEAVSTHRATEREPLWDIVKQIIDAGRVTNCWNEVLNAFEFSQPVWADASE